jgi:molybdenum cofactor cytidylyltransferase
MDRIPSLCGVILAAGESSRMGTDKALLPWPPPPNPGSNSGSTFLSSSIQLLSPYNDMVFVVAGKNANAIAPVVYANGAFLVENPDPARGQFSSLRIGLQEVLTRGRDSVMLTLVDRPPVRQETVETLAAAFHQALAASKWAVVPENNGKHGHPIIIGRDMVEAFLKAPETATARDVEHEHRDKIDYVSIPDTLIAVNINTPEDYAALKSAASGIPR